MSSYLVKLGKSLLPVLLASTLATGMVAKCWALGDGASVYTTKLDDPRAIYLTGAVGDGKADDTAALQAAIDKAYADRKEGIVFIPEGRYRISRTLYLWPCVRLIGWGANRPVIVLGDNTPGFQKAPANMLMFAGAILRNVIPPPTKPAIPPPGNVPPDDSIPDANPSTFFNGISNINLEIGKGNPGAVGVRFHGAQHNFLTHMDFHIGSGLAGVYQVANVAEDLRFYGGRYGILAEKPAPAWQFTLLDSQFDGQRDAAIREHEASLTLVNVSFRNTPVGIEIDEDYADWLWAKNTRFENISKAAVIISAENNVYNQIGFENAVANNVPVFARFRQSGKTLGSPSGSTGAYEVKSLNHGLILKAPGQMGKIDTLYDAVPLTTMPAPLPPAIRALPPTEQWVNLKSLGAKGDNKTDDTEAVRNAIANHKVIYVPSGRYIVSDTIALKPDTVLIGLHPSITQFDLPDLVPSYQGVGAPKPLLLVPPGGDNIVSGIGFDPGGLNPRAVAILWQSGANSLMNDIFFPSGSGTSNADGTPWEPYNPSHTGDTDPRKRWDGQYPSLWVTNGGGGTFSNIWTPAAYSQTGMLVSHTKTPGFVYQVSSEHHGRSEFALRDVENWTFYASQTEEERAESLEATSFEIIDSRNITIANHHAYRVTKTYGPMDAGTRIFNSTNIRFRNMHVNAESGFAVCDKNGCGTHLRVNKFPFDNAIRDATHKIDVREREFAYLDYNPEKADRTVNHLGNKVEKLEEGFYSISGAAVDAKGKLYFVDKHQQRIYSWAKGEGLRIERDNPLDPVNLAFDQSGNLLVLSKDGVDATVYSFKPGTPATELTVIPPTPTKKHPKASILLPGNYWKNGEFRDQLNFKTMKFTTLAEMLIEELATPNAKEYVSPDGSVVLPATRVFRQGTPDWAGWRFSHTLNTYGFINAPVGKRAFFINTSEVRTYSGMVNADGTVTDLKPFVDRGGESVAVDAAGNVYIANGQVLVYDKTGKSIGQIDVPERPIQLVFGGEDKRTLFILTHHGLYSVDL